MTPEHLEAGLEDVATAESPTLDFKAMLPPQGNNESLVKDVAAMSTDGGVLIYGVTEDKQVRRFEPAPIELNGAAERVDQIVNSGFSRPPTIQIRELSKGDGTGYLVVVVPPSPMAPHQVQTTGRFYGRGPTGNRRLEQGDIDRLYERRAKWEHLGEVAIDDAIEASPLLPIADEEQMGMLLVVHPVAGAPTLRVSILDGNQRIVFNELLNATQHFPRYSVDQSFRLHELSRGEVTETIDGVAILSNGPGYILPARLEITNDLTIRFESIGLARIPRDPDNPVIHDTTALQMVGDVLRMAGQLFRRAGYAGAIDLGFVLFNAQGAASHRWQPQNMGVTGPTHRLGLLRPAILRVDTLALLDDTVNQTGKDLVTNYHRVLSPPVWPHALDLAAPPR